MYLALEERKKIEKYEPQRVAKVKFYELLGKQGPGYWYQLRFFIIFGLQWLIGAQILLGFRFIFQEQSFHCHNNLSMESCKEFVCNLSRNEQINYIVSLGKKRITGTSEFMFFCEDQYKINVISSVSAFSCLIGFILFPHLSNIKGPKFTIILGQTISLIGCLVIFLAESFTILIMGCCLQFVALRPIMTLHFTFINDNTQDKFRQFSTLGLQLFFGLGQIILILIQYLTLNWRNAILYFQFIPMVLILIATFFCLFESPIYEHKNSTIAAINILNKIAKINKNEEIKVNILQSRLLNLNQKSPNFIDILKPRKLRTQIFATSVIFFVIQVAYFSASYYMNKEKLNIYQNNLIIVSSEFLAIAITNIFIISIKRKQIIFFGLVTGAIITFSFIFIPIPIECRHQICLIKIIQILLLSILSFSFSICWSIFYVYIPELFSIDINSLVLGINGMCGVIGSFLVPYLVMLFEGNFNYMFLLGILLLIASVHLIFVDETHGKQIPLDKLQESQELINQEEEIIALEL